MTEVSQEVVELLMADLRLSMFGALQHPNDAVRAGAWAIVDDANAVRPAMERPSTPTPPEPATTGG